MEPQVRNRIDSIYPGDRATGYAKGDLRGFVRIEMKKNAIE
jgi:hypothetical protein